MYILRTRIKKDIICEFLPPARRPRTGGRGADKVIILCGGMPGYPGKRDALMQFLSKKGYWTFVPRYRGTWESGGSFLRISPHRDVLDVIAQLPRGFRDLWSGKLYTVRRPEIYLIGSSFGGPAAILASRDPRVRRAVAFSPVTDWRVETRSEPIEKMQHFTRDAFGNAYRGSARDWQKLKSGAFYNPAHEAASIDGAKLLVFHAKDDKIVYAKTSAAFARATGARLVLLPRGGHLSISHTMAPAFWKKIRLFLK
ncbi:MAG TPA: alpha/beta fold hydrolase [Candidatus Paceibacterota bacterium]|nr:alpha/beta fold hydrolase [Candidatus Paceibacterota bacterium]